MQGREQRIAAIAGQQDNVITRDQLERAGLRRGAISHRLAVSTLQRLYGGVYLLGAAPPTDAAKARAAALAGGPKAVVSHRSAATLWRMLDTGGPEVHVLVSGRNPGSRSGLKVHRTLSLDQRDVRRLRGIPLTSPARTICDLAATEPTNVLERALNEAYVRGLTDEGEVKQAISRASSRRGVRRLRRLLDQNPTITRNDAERLLLRLIREANLPRPLTNTPLLGYNVDFFWPEQRLVVEFDGFAAHGHLQAFERDRRRDRELIATGYRVIHVTWRQLIEEPLAVVVDIAKALLIAA